MKKEIVVDARMAANSGIGTYIRSILPRIKDAYRLRILIHRETSLKCPELACIEQIFTLAPLYSIQEQIALPLVIPRCDLFWSPHFNVPLAPVRAKKRLTTIHDVFFLAHPKSIGIHKQMYTRFMFGAAARRSDHLITGSQFSFSEIIKYVGSYQHKITEIPLGIDRHIFSASLDLERPAFALPSKYILYVGNLALHKNIVRLIQSLDFLPKDIHLVLVGKETRDNFWKQEAQKRIDRITLCGEIDRTTLAWIYRHATLLIHPSLYEGFGLTPLEAMSAGCPVVVSQIPCLKETCGDAAVFVDPMSPQAIAEGISSVWQNLALQQTLQEKGHKHSQKFCWQRSAERHLEIIERLLSQSSV